MCCASLGCVSPVVGWGDILVFGARVVLYDIIAVSCEPDACVQFILGELIISSERS